MQKVVGSNPISRLSKLAPGAASAFRREADRSAADGLQLRLGQIGNAS